MSDDVSGQIPHQSEFLYISVIFNKKFYRFTQCDLISFGPDKKNCYNSVNSIILMLMTGLDIFHNQEKNVSSVKIKWLIKVLKE